VKKKAQRRTGLHWQRAKGFKGELFFVEDLLSSKKMKPKIRMGKEVGVTQLRKPTGMGKAIRYETMCRYFR